ncbi:tRNA pseudouridine(38-40) synthase TruA [Bacillota bacterium LX-D]|nr:tRNA pseudouridine(38-40) synthase TruA [Bacillota bacterium LX-D]
MKRRIKITLAYDGTGYSGWQVQSNHPHISTIQGVVEQKISLLTKESIKVVASGRTDAGVHALGQVIHFDTFSSIPVEKFPAALLSVFPQDIVPLAAEEVNQYFHARYSVKEKTYRYSMDLGTMPHVFWRRFAYHYPYPLNIVAMQEAAKLLIGQHDFKSFCASGSSVQNYVRRIKSCRIRQDGTQLHLEITGDGFLYNMVRIIMGTLLEVGRGKLGIDDLTEIIAAQDRTKAGPTAPAHGLCLLHVQY